jgi:MoaA/NifB/PqqE/SkfB family radical SAM enzyme
MIGSFTIGNKPSTSTPPSTGGCSGSSNAVRSGCGTGSAGKANNEDVLLRQLAEEQARNPFNGQLDIKPDGGVWSNFVRLFRKHGKYLIRYPHITRRVAWNYFRLVVLRQPVLRQVEFAVTYWCNAYCDHCSATTMHRSGPGEMELELVDRVLGECIDLGALSINITGGEALQHPRIIDIIKAAHPKRAVVSIASNGLLLTNSMARRCAEAGVRIASLALDSAYPEVHDERKKIKGCFDTLMKAIKHCQEYGIEVFLCTILTPVNMANGDAWEMVKLAERLGCTLTVNIANAVGSWMGNNEVLLSEAQVKQFHEMVKHPLVRWDGGSNYLKSGCPAGIEKIYISSFGEVTPCPRIHLAYGNVKEEPLKAIWRRMVQPEGEWGSVHRGGCPVGDDAEFRERVMKPIDDAGGRLHVSQHPHLTGSSSSS